MNVKALIIEQVDEDGSLRTVCMEPKHGEPLIIAFGNEYDEPRTGPFYFVDKRHDKAYGQAFANCVIRKLGAADFVEHAGQYSFYASWQGMPTQTNYLSYYALSLPEFAVPDFVAVSDPTIPSKSYRKAVYRDDLRNRFVVAFECPNSGEFFDFELKIKFRIDQERFRIASYSDDFTIRHGRQFTDFERSVTREEASRIHKFLKQTIIMGDQYDIGQAGAVGPYVKATDMNFQQTLQESQDNHEMPSSVEKPATPTAMKRTGGVSPHFRRMAARAETFDKPATEVPNDKQLPDDFRIDPNGVKRKLAMLSQNGDTAYMLAHDNQLKKELISNLDEILIVAATEVEHRAVLDGFHEITGKRPRQSRINQRIYFDLGKIGASHVTMALCEAGSGGLAGSQESVRVALEDINPDCVFSVGIAFGVDEKEQALGDILISQRLCPYDLRRQGKTIFLRDDRPHADPDLFNWCMATKLIWNGTTVRDGIILSGDSLVDDVDYRDQLRKLQPEAIGGEMEGAGLYVACHNKRKSWILIKAICDWADGNLNNPNKIKNQREAARNAVSFLLSVLKSSFDENSEDKIGPFTEEEHIGHPQRYGKLKGLIKQGDVEDPNNSGNVDRESPRIICDTGIEETQYNFDRLIDRAKENDELFFVGQSHCHIIRAGLLDKIQSTKSQVNLVISPFDFIKSLGDRYTTDYLHAIWDLHHFMKTLETKHNGPTVKCCVHHAAISLSVNAHRAYDNGKIQIVMTPKFLDTAEHTGRIFCVLNSEQEDSIRFICQNLVNRMRNIVNDPKAIPLSDAFDDLEDRGEFLKLKAEWLEYGKEYSDYKASLHKNRHKMSRSIALINPPVPFLSIPNAGPNLGLLYLAAYLKQQNKHYTIKIFDYCVKDYRTVDIYGYDFYCFTATTPQYPYAIDILKELRQTNSDIKFIIGGPHATACPDDVIADGFDIVITREGELVLNEVVSQKAVNGIYQGKQVHDISELPFPDYSLIDMHAYEYSFKSKNIAQILTSRGCPHRCNFCFIPTMNDYVHRQRGISNVKREIQELIDVYKIDGLYFVDPTFAVNEKITVQICKFLRDRNISWVCQTRPEYVNENLLEFMADSGCKRISYGVETPADHSLNNMSKGTSVSKLIRAITDTKKAGIDVRYYLMWGLPWDNPKTAEAIMDFVTDFPPDGWHLSTFIPYPGTVYWEKPDEFGLTIVDRDFRNYYHLGKGAKGRIVTANRDCSKEELEELRDIIFKHLLSVAPDPRVLKGMRG